MFFPVNGDPNYANVSLLLPMTGANNSTTFTDVSPTPKAITRYGDTKVLTAQSKWGNGSGYFDGAGDYLRTPYSGDFQLRNVNFTVEAWIYLSAANTNLGLLNFRQDAPSRGWGWRKDSNNKLLFFFTGGTALTSSGTVSAGQWTHVATVCSGTTLTHYINGTASGSVTVSSFGSDSSGLLYIGCENDLSGPWKGYLQDVRMTKGLARYTANFTPHDAPLSPRLNELKLSTLLQQPHQFHQTARLGL